MKSFVKNIEEIAFKNEDFRQVLYTANNCRLVMHKLDHFMEEGTGEAFLDGVRTKISAGFAVLVPVKTNYNINTGRASMKLYSFYAPSNR